MDWEIDLYENAHGKCPFVDWIEALRDLQARAKVQTRLERLRLGNFGDCRSVGEGVHELRVNFGPGYRVYFSQVDIKLVLLLIGGSKRTQEKDIKKAKLYLADYKSHERELVYAKE